MGLKTLTFCLAFALWGGAAAAADQCAEAGAAVDTARELFITDPAVVASARAEPGGPWHFAAVIKRLLPAGATDKDASDFLQAWLGSWDAEQKLVPDPTKPGGPDNPVRTLPRRAAVAAKVGAAWLAASQKARQAAGEPEDGSLKLDLAPFALRALVYRPDRRDRTHCASSAGEGRFLFAALAQPTAHPTTAAETLEMTVIFEYDLPVAGGQTAKIWAARWHALGAAAAGPDYLAALAALTAEFSVGPQLGQVRTNEILSFPSELRQFELVEAAPGRMALANAPVAQTPDLSLNNSAALAAWANADRAAILAETHVMPPALIGFTAPVPRATSWRLPAVADEELRFKLGKNTCNGCHSFEHGRIPDVDGLWQFAPDGRLSGFLTEQDLPARQAEVCGLLAAAQCRDEAVPPAPKNRGRAH